MANQTKKSVSIAGKKLSVEYVPVSSLRPAPYNPRIWSKEATEQLAESIKRFGVVDPLLCNSNPKRKGIIIGGNFRASVFKKLGITTCPVVWVDIADSEKEKELCIRLNKNTGSFDWDLLADFGENFLADIGFSSEELDDVFEIDETPEVFDLAKELRKLQIEKVEVQKMSISSADIVLCAVTVRLSPTCSSSWVTRRLTCASPILHIFWII